MTLKSLDDVICNGFILHNLFIPRYLSFIRTYNINQMAILSKCAMKQNSWSKSLQLYNVLNYLYLHGEEIRFDV